MSHKASADMPTFLRYPAVCFDPPLSLKTPAAGKIRPAPNFVFLKSLIFLKLELVM